jgi:hypothetical protein
MSDFRIKESDIASYLERVGKLSDETLALVGVARITWDTWSPRRKMMKLVELGMLRIQELDANQ